MKILAKAVSAPDTEYRNALVLASFLNREDATTVVAALDERRRYGVSITPVVDLITAWSAVVGAGGIVRHPVCACLFFQNIQRCVAVVDRLLDCHKYNYTYFQQAFGCGLASLFRQGGIIGFAGGGVCKLQRRSRVIC